VSEKNDTAERRFKPTRRRLRRARRDGDVPLSQELNGAFALAGWTLVMTLAGAWTWRNLAALVTQAIEAPDHPTTALMLQRLMTSAITVGVLTTALCATAGMFATLGGILQSGPVFSLKKLAPDFSRLNPARGLSEGLKLDSLMSLARTIVVASALTILLYHRTLAALPRLLTLPHAGISGFAVSLWEELLGALRCATLVAFAVGAADLLYQRYAYEKRLRMTPEEFKRDRKEAEGDPRLKRRRRRLFRDWITHSAISATQAATVVVTNPTHLAIALNYDPELNAAPTIAAKGAGELATQIRRAAEDVGVPIIENVPLARALHADGDIDDVVPEILFAAVAEVIVWANQVREFRRAEETSLA